MTAATLTEAIDAFSGEMRRGQWSVNSQDRYGRELRRLADHVGADRPVSEIDRADVRSYLDTFDNHAASTVALEHTIASSFYKFLVLNEYVDVNPLERIKRPRVPALRDRVRVRVTRQQVEQMLAACDTWSEILCLNTLAFLGVRRTALSNLRWSDVDGKRHTATFLEKGGKVIAKPLPTELRKVYAAYAMERSAQGNPIAAEEWVVPNRRPMASYDTRSARVIYAIVKDVAERCGIDAHVHSLRAAFAVQFLRSNPAHIEPLRQLMGHSSISTTQGYLSEMEGEDAMQSVVSLSYEAVAA